MKRQRGWLNGSCSRCSRARYSRSRCSRDGGGGGGGVRARACAWLRWRLATQHHNATTARTHAHTRAHTHATTATTATSPSTSFALFPRWRWRRWRCVCARACVCVRLWCCVATHARTHARAHTHTHNHRRHHRLALSPFVRCLHGGGVGGGGVCARVCVRVCVVVVLCGRATLQPRRRRCALRLCDCAKQSACIPKLVQLIKFTMVAPQAHRIHQARSSIASRSSCMVINRIKLAKYVYQFHQVHQVRLSSFIVFIKSTHQVLMNLMNRQHGRLGAVLVRGGRVRQVCSSIASSSSSMIIYLIKFTK